MQLRRLSRAVHAAVGRGGAEGRPVRREASQHLPLLVSARQAHRARPGARLTRASSPAPQGRLVRGAAARGRRSRLAGFDNSRAARSFMAIAFLSSQRSKDPKKQARAWGARRPPAGKHRAHARRRWVHALSTRSASSSASATTAFLGASSRKSLVRAAQLTQRRRRGCADDLLPWAKSSTDGDILKTKVPYVVHAGACRFAARLRSAS